MRAADDVATIKAAMDKIQRERWERIQGKPLEETVNIDHDPLPYWTAATDYDPA
jgi:hypothetical protein